MCVSYFRINFETRSIRLHFKIRDQNCMAHRGNTWNKRSLFACDPLSIRFVHTPESNGRSGRRERRRYSRETYIVEIVLPFAGAQSVESKLNSVKSPIVPSIHISSAGSRKSIGDREDVVGGNCCARKNYKFFDSKKRWCNSRE